jgi:hypothetical protein
MPLTVNETGSVNILGVSFPVVFIYAAMSDTGGLLVTDSTIHNKLSDTMKVWLLNHEYSPESPPILIIESIPTIDFIPVRVRLHTTTDTEGIQTNMFLFFARRKLFHA